MYYLDINFNLNLIVSSAEISIYEIPFRIMFTYCMYTALNPPTPFDNPSEQIRVACCKIEQIIQIDLSKRLVKYL